MGCRFYLLVALGSALGGVVRAVLSQLIPAAKGFPWATLTINVTGSLLIGLFSGLLTHLADGGLSPMLRALLVVGLCGGFTTFSTFSNETFRLLESSHYLSAAGYVSASVLGGLLSVFLGQALALRSAC